MLPRGLRAKDRTGGFAVLIPLHIMGLCIHGDSPDKNNGVGCMPFSNYSIYLIDFLRGLYKIMHAKPLAKHIIIVITVNF